MVQEMFPILSTPDLSRSLAFYRDLLSGEVTYRFPPHGVPEFVALRYGPSSLGIAAEPADESPPSTPTTRFALWIYVDDCDARHTSTAGGRGAGHRAAGRPALG